MKFYKPVKKQYFYLSSDTANEVVNHLGLSFSWKWKIPSFSIRNGEVKLKNLNALNVVAADTFIIRLKSPITDNCYDSTSREPILYTSTGLNYDVFNDTPELRIHNKTIDEIVIKMSNGIDIANIDAGINANIVFILLLEFTDYEPEDTMYSYNVNDKQNYNPRII